MDEGDGGLFHGDILAFGEPEETMSTSGRIGDSWAEIRNYRYTHTYIYVYAHIDYIDTYTHTHTCVQIRYLTKLVAR
jgi:hypothetical protein